MGGYGKILPVTGIAALSIGGASIEYPVIAAIGGVAVIAGFLVLRLVRPARNPRA